MSIKAACRFTTSIFTGSVSSDELDALNLREYLYADGVSLIEWFEYLPAAEVDEYLEVRLAHGGGSKRELSFIAHGERYEKIVDKIKK